MNGTARKACGAVLGAYGVAALAAAAGLGWTAVTAPEVEGVGFLDAAACGTRLAGFGFTAAPDGAKVAVAGAGRGRLGDEWGWTEVALSEASAAALACPGYRMAEFCTGQGCGLDGWQSWRLVLSPAETQEIARRR